MKKVLGQTVRDIKREVNKKVLKVPGIEQKVLDATSNEPWGPHGSLLTDIAEASRNYHEYQMIMGVIWKRLSDTGKNWRHVYKGLTVLEYMVGHGSERVIDEIRERAYQISTLAGFQYIDSSGRDQGSNVRKKSQSLVALVNDKERIAEVRQKAAANRDKYRGSAAGGMYKPSGGYGDRYDYENRYGGRDEERSSYGRESENGCRDDDRYSRDGDRYSRDSDDRYGRDGYRDDDNRGRSRSTDYQYGSRSRSSDRDRAFEDDGQSSSRGSGARADDQSQEGSRLERKFSEQNIGAPPPSYEEAVNESRSPVHSERDGGETPQVASGAAPASASSPAGNSADKTSGFGDESSLPAREVEAFDEFDPRGSVPEGPPASAPVDTAPAPASSPPTSAPPTSNNVEIDLLGSLSDVFAPNPLAIVPSDSASVESNGQPNNGPAPSFTASQSSTQPFDDPFGDSPFQAIPSPDTDPSSHQGFATPFQPTQPAHTTEVSHLAAPKPDSADNFGFGDSFSASAVANPNPGAPNLQPPSNLQAFPQEQLTTSESEFDILAGILPPSGPPASLPSQPGAAVPISEFAPNGNTYQNFHPQPVSTTAPNMAAQSPFGQAAQPYNMVSQPQNLTGGMPFNHQQCPAGPPNSQIPQYAPQSTSGGYHTQPVSAPPSSSQTPYCTLSASSGQLDGGNFMTMQQQQQQQRGPGTASPGPVLQHGINAYGDVFTSTGPNTLGKSSSQPALTPLTGALDMVPQPQAEKKFEPKSAIWADTLSRGLVNFNISGPKTNPLADIGVDFDAINRKEKRLEKQTTPQVTSTISMGKAMGSGSGLGRAGASGMRPPTTPMVGPNMAMGGMNTPQPMGMGMGMGMGGGYGQGYPMQPQPGMAPGPGMPGAYNPMMGQGGYNPQHPYGGYR